VDVISAQSTPARNATRASAQFPSGVRHDAELIASWQRRSRRSSIHDSNRPRQREVVDAFLAASRGGDFEALLAMLDLDVVLRADGAAVKIGASNEVRGATAVAGTFFGRARFAQPALLNGAAGAVWAQAGRPRVVFAFTITGGKIVKIDLIADLERLRQLDLVVCRAPKRHS
jgi:RNA polymerase sigma-70 factor (ECF subfamily)